MIMILARVNLSRPVKGGLIGQNEKLKVLFP
jgi:hypothetical protein